MLPVEQIMNKLNEGIKLIDIAAEIDLKIDVLSNKLESAKVIYNKEKDTWICISKDPKRSLQRDIFKPIKVLKVDKEGSEIKQKNNVTNLINENKEFELYMTYRAVEQKQLIEKKSFFLTSEMYKRIKYISKEHSIKINGLINVLLQKGLDYYNLSDIQISEDEIPKVLNLDEKRDTKKTSGN